MASPPPSGGSSTPKRHSKNISINRARLSTRGPLDVDDPLAPAAPPTQEAVAAEAANTPVPTIPFSPECPPAVVAKALPPPPFKDFSYLLRPEIYHPLSQLDLPPPFRAPSHQPLPSTPLATLLSYHNFRSAATAAALRLCTAPAPPPHEVFALIYTRLTCLTLINHLAFAAEESKALQDINSPFYIDEISKTSILPWELRVLVVRLQGVGYGDDRREVGGYYELAREARLGVKESRDEEEKLLWMERLKELGIFVANALIEMGDLGAATRHLETLKPRDGMADEVLMGRLALCYINLGDLDAARRCIASSSSSNATLAPLLSMAEGRYSDAVEEWRALPQTDLVMQNLAVCLFYTGKVDKTLKFLDGLIEKGRTFHALTFNLATVYELCSEKGREWKEELVERVGRVIHENGGGERSSPDFKL
ncbi:hypothetical protein N7G274_001703 [Stereocaulon virgatum]|uniref:Trafficking protein particle complex subunit 12 n=1 Tax=Stereocaulon virgatum TaxID=373712 RepID=A0ABR4AL80_9LECA